jgi:hypothetical protein
MITERKTDMIITFNHRMFGEMIFDNVTKIEFLPCAEEGCKKHEIIIRRVNDNGIAEAFHVENISNFQCNLKTINN